MSKTTQTCSVCGEEFSSRQFCPSCGHDQRFYSHPPRHTPAGISGTVGKTALAVIGSWFLIAAALVTYGATLATRDSGYDPEYAVFWFLIYLAVLYPLIGVSAGLVALIFSRQTGAGILAGVGVATVIGVLALLLFMSAA